MFFRWKINSFSAEVSVKNYMEAADMQPTNNN